MSVGRLVPVVTVAFGAIAAAAVVLLGAGCSEPPVQAHTIEHLSPAYTVDRVYKSMKGPSSTQTVFFPQFDEPELVWVTGYHAVMVGADGETPVSQEFMCHSNLDFDAKRHADLFDLEVYHTSRLFTLSQGQFDIKLPEGFGLPYYTDEAFTLTTQVLNLNPDGKSREVRHRISIDYVLDRDLKQPIKPLFMTSGWGLVLLDGEDGYYGVADPSEEEHGPGCLPGEAAGFDNYTDEFARRFSGHWVVKPGREENRTLVTRIMAVPYDTTAHYIAVHLHPFAESLELVDLTAGESVFKSNVDNAEGKIGLDRVEYFSSEEGIPIYADHDYELVSIYNNTTSEDQDSMAVMLFYLLDKKFEKVARPPVTGTQVAHVERPIEMADELLELRTNHGKIEIALYPTAAPNHVARILELARLEAFDGVSFMRVEPGFLVQTGYPSSRRGEPLSLKQEAAIRPLRAEFTDIEHRRGTVSMVLNNNADPHSAEASFFILLGDALHLDGRHTVLGEVVGGMETLDRIAELPRTGTMPTEPVLIESARVVDRATKVAGR